MNAQIFLYKAAWSQLRSAASNLLRRGTVRRAERTVDTVRKGYDAGRSRVEIGDFETLVIGSLPKDFVLLDGRLQFGDPQQAVVARMERLLALVHRYARDGAVVEFGSGAGRNLLYLARHGISNPLIGLELSSISVDLSRRAAEKFELDIRFETCDVTKGLPDLGTVDVVFSVHAFEMMPRIFVDGIENIRRLNPRAVIFLEPIEELWPWSLRGLLARLRVRQLDRLRGFFDVAKGLGTAVEARELGYATNPFNTTSLLVIERPGSRS